MMKGFLGKSLRLLSSAPGRPAGGGIGGFPLRSLLRQNYRTSKPQQLHK
jgi:hypothetical protein